MRLTLKEKRSVVKVVALRYKKASKKEKKVILNEFIELTGYNRSYGTYLLRSHGKRIRISKDLVAVFTEIRGTPYVIAEKDLKGTVLFN